MPAFEDAPSVQRALAAVFGSDSDVGAGDQVRPATRAPSSPATRADDRDASDRGPDRENVAIESTTTPVMDDDDVNILEEGEVLDDCESDCSANENVPGEVATAEDQAAPMSPEEADADGEVEERVTEAFMRAIGGAVRVEYGDIDQDVLRRMQ